jgi:hypothetical protein
VGGTSHSQCTSHVGIIASIRILAAFRSRLLTWVIGYCIVCARVMVQVQDLKVLLQLLDMEQVGGQLGIIVAAFSFHLLDDQVGVTFY